MTSTHFPLGIRVEFHDDDPNKVTLIAPFIYLDEKLDIMVEIPEGFVSDGNSVPKAFQGYFGRWECPESGVVHDWLYAAPGAYYRHHSKSDAWIPNTDPDLALTRGECDNIHRRILDLKGFRWSKRQTLWSILRTFGGMAWSRHRSEDPKEMNG